MQLFWELSRWFSTSLAVRLLRCVSIPLLILQDLSTRLTILLLVCCVSPVTGNALAHDFFLSDSSLLPAERAFKVEAKRHERNLLVTLSIADGYYVYRERLTFSAEPKHVLGQAHIPKGELKQDAYFGKQQVLTGINRISIPLHTHTSQAFTLIVQLQGCALAKICYPPVVRKLSIANGTPITDPPSHKLITPSRLPSTFTAAPTQHTTAPNHLTHPNLVGEKAGTGTVLLAFFLSGLALAFTACLYPLLPIVSALIIGQRQELNRTRGLLLTFIYVQGLALTYTVIGVLAGTSGWLLSSWLQHPLVQLIAVIFTVVFALAMFEVFVFQLPNHWQTRLTQLANRQKGRDFFAIFLMGAISALIIGPCVAPPLALALGYIASTKDTLLGGLALYCMALGTGLPLLIIGMLGGHVLPRAGSWMTTIKALVGVIMLGLAIQFASPLLPSSAILLCWAMLCIGTAIFLRATDSLEHDASRIKRLAKAVGTILLLIGIAQLIGALAGNQQPLKPLHGLLCSRQITDAAPTFQAIASLEDLKRELSAAHGQPILLKIHADWCTTCKEMEATTFTEPDVIHTLRSFVLLRMDITHLTEAQRQLLQYIGVFGPPALILFNQQGKQAKPPIIGYVDSKALLPMLISIKQK